MINYDDTYSEKDCVMPLNLMGRKKGMTRVFDEKGNSVVCTVIELEPNVISQVKTEENDGYTAIQLAAHAIPDSKKRRVSKPLVGHFAKANVDPRKSLAESRINADETYEVGQSVGLEYFKDVEFVDVAGTSKGKGFQGAIKRYGFKGGRASHGSGFHRALGSTGMRSTPGRTFPGKKMPGQMGNVRVTVENLRVVKIDEKNQVLLVKGAIPGSKSGLVYIRKAIKK